MNTLTENYALPESPEPLTGKTLDVPILNDNVLKLKSLLEYLIASDIHGKENILSVTKKYQLDLSYSSVMDKLSKYQKLGASSLIRKPNPSKDNLKSFSPQVLQTLQRIFIDKIRGGSIIRAYEDTHKYLRSISCEFTLASTGECFLIQNGCLLDVANNKILSHLSTLFEAGCYTLKPENSKGNNLYLNIGSYSSAARFLSKVKKDSSQAIYLSRFGIYDYRNRRQHTMKLDYSKMMPNDLIIGDGKKLDILVISDDWTRIYRPYLMGWYDAHTRRYCYELSNTETSEAICNSLATAIRQWGLPKVCKTDNGKSYRSGRFQQMKESLGIESAFAKVKLARAKPIESFHNVLDQLLCTSIGYTGNKYQNFPDDTRKRLKLVAGMQKDISKIEKNFKHETNEDCNFINLPIDPQARLKSSKNRFMHISELIALLDTKLNEYHSRIHGGLSKDSLGKEVYNINCSDKDISENINTPNGRYEYATSKGFVPVKVSPASVAIYAMNIALRTVQLKTGISLNNEEYYHPALYKIAGDKVLIRYSRYAPEFVYIFHSAELQAVNEQKQITPEILNSLKFFCLADRNNMLDYNDPAYLDKLLIQKNEEKQLKLAIADKPDVCNSNIVAMTNMDSQLDNIEESKISYLNKKSYSQTKFKKLNDD